MAGFEEWVEEYTRIPLDSASAFLVEMRRPSVFPTRTPGVEAGLRKLAAIAADFGEAPEALSEAERAALIDPNVQEALSYEQAMAERDEFMAQSQQLQQAVQQAQQQAAEQQQAAQQAAEQSQQLQQMLQNEQAQREQATIAAIQTKDQNLQDQMAAAQKREELVGLADNLKAQLESLRAGLDETQAAVDQTQASAAEPPQQMQARQQEEQMAAEQQAAMEQQAALPQGTKKETEQAQRAQAKADEQAQQAQQSQEQVAQQQQMMQQPPMQQQMPQAAPQPPVTPGPAAKMAALLKRAGFMGDIGQTTVGGVLGATAGLGASVLSKGKINPRKAMSVGGIGGAALGTAPWVMRTGREAKQNALSKGASTRLLKLAATVEAARDLGEKIGVVWDRVDFTPADLAKGMSVEHEHNRGSTDVVDDSNVDLTTAKIALAHLRERGDYYKLLQTKVEDAPKEKVALAPAALGRLVGHGAALGTLGGGVAGSAIGGAVGGLTAEKGHRWRGIGRGAAYGGLTGATVGGISSGMAVPRMVKALEGAGVSVPSTSEALMHAAARLPKGTINPAWGLGTTAIQVAAPAGAGAVAGLQTRRGPRPAAPAEKTAASLPPFLRGAASGALGGGLAGASIGGGTGALSAEKGHRLEGALRGALPGAAVGSATGALMGGAHAHLGMKGSALANVSDWRNLPEAIHLEIGRGTPLEYLRDVVSYNWKKLTPAQKAYTVAEFPALIASSEVASELGAREGRKAGRDLPEDRANPTDERNKEASLRRWVEKIAGGEEKPPASAGSSGNVAGLDCARQQSVSEKDIGSGVGGDALRKALDYITSEKHRGAPSLPTILPSKEQPVTRLQMPEDRDAEEKIEGDKPKAASLRHWVAGRLDEIEKEAGWLDRAGALIGRTAKKSVPVVEQAAKKVAPSAEELAAKAAEHAKQMESLRSMSRMRLGDTGPGSMLTGGQHAERMGAGRRAAGGR